MGLAVGFELSKHFDDVVIVEKEDSYGRHTSSRNSEVIHSGIYYPNGSLKAKLCLEGRILMYEYLKEKCIPYRQCGKLVIAATAAELPALKTLKENGIRNGVEDLEIINKGECKKLAPEVIAEKAMVVPCTGILDTHRYMQHLKVDFEENDGFILFDMEVINITKDDDRYIVAFSNGEEFKTEFLINCAGLECENIARYTGIETINEGLKIHWCKAEYFKTTERFSFDRLIYPMPDPTGMYLGIHLTLNLAGEIRFGPSAYYVNELHYGMDDTNKQTFIDSVSKYLRIDTEKLHPDDTGIRPKLQGEGEGFRDFYINEETEKGLKGFINLMGIESPGLTASLAIGKYVKELM